MQGQPPLRSPQADLCILPAALWRPGPASTPGASATAAGPAPRLPTAGLQLTGFVRLHSAAGPGLAHVSIYRRLGAAAPELLATTTASGSFEAGCMGLPGATWVTVWAEAPGYTLEPQQYLWRHASGYEARRLPFVAHPLESSCPAPGSAPLRLSVQRATLATAAETTRLSIGLAAGSVPGSAPALLTVSSAAGSISARALLSTATPLELAIPLLPNTRDYLTVAAQFEDSRGCAYTTRTAYDLFGLPLEVLRLAHALDLPALER